MLFKSKSTNYDPSIPGKPQTQILRFYGPHRLLLWLLTRSINSLKWKLLNLLLQQSQFISFKKYFLVADIQQSRFLTIIYLATVNFSSLVMKLAYEIFSFWTSSHKLIGGKLCTNYQVSLKKERGSVVIIESIKKVGDIWFRYGAHLFNVGSHLQSCNSTAKYTQCWNHFAHKSM